MVRKIDGCFQQVISGCGKHRWNGKQKGKLRSLFFIQAIKDAPNNGCSSPGNAGNHGKTLDESDGESPFVGNTFQVNGAAFFVPPPFCQSKSG